MVPSEPPDTITDVTTTNISRNAGAQIADLEGRRRARGLTQVKLALAAGVSLGTVRNAESGLPVSAETRERLEGVLEAA